MPVNRALKDAGISLIEMVVAILVLSIGVAAGFQSLAQARRAIGDELPRFLAEQVALNRAEELQLRGAGSSLPDSVSFGGRDWSVETEFAATEGGFVEARIHARAANSPGAILVVYAPVEPPQ